MAMFDRTSCDRAAAAVPAASHRHGIAQAAVRLLFGLALGLALRPVSAEAAGVLTYLVHGPAETSAHPPLIVLLHGSGADERDMIGLWSDLPGAFVVVSPRAPFSDGSGGYRWYRKGGGRDGDIEVSRKSIDLLLDDAVKRFDADPKRVFLAGFSQGAVMTYDIALKEPGRFRGAAILSGSLFGAAEVRPSAARSGDAFFIGHGTADDRIPFGAATSARATLAGIGAAVEFHAYPGLHHGIGDAETKDLSRWLSGRLAVDPGNGDPQR